MQVLKLYYNELHWEYNHYSKINALLIINYEYLHPCAAYCNLLRISCLEQLILNTSIMYFYSQLIRCHHWIQLPNYHQHKWFIYVDYHIILSIYHIPDVFITFTYLITMFSVGLVSIWWFGISIIWFHIIVQLIERWNPLKLYIRRGSKVSCGMTLWGLEEKPSLVCTRYPVVINLKPVSYSPSSKH